VSEIEDLREIISNLNKNLIENKDKIKQLDKENEYLQDEYSKALDRNNKLLGELKEKETEYKTKNQELANDFSLKSEANLQTIQNLNNELEFQSNNFKDKLKQLNIQNMQAISMLQQQLEESKEDIDKLNKKFNELKMNPSESNISINLSASSLSSNQISPMHRQSSSNSITTNETVVTNNNNNNNNNDSIKTSSKSFEQLLNEPSDPIVNLNETKIILNQIETLKNELNKAKLQLEHLNELLNESELNNVRLTEQINVLKEEIRR
jgi:chromosome segregation ATPase